jgi:Zn-dependent protease
MALTFTIVLVGWVFSLCLHEFSHAFVAYLGGDYTVREKGYLTNPLKYIHPIFSILIPLAMLAMGGIGLPGGAVYIESWRLRSRWWETAVSLAGPASNMILALILSIALQFAPNSYGLTELPYDSIWPGLAFLAFLQITAVLFNLLPFPPFDGYGAVRPHLDPSFRQTLDFFAPYSIMVIFILFWQVEPVSDAFFRIASNVANFMQIPMQWAYYGSRLFAFWRL